jgi:pyruvate-formate lyase-activating enzyme
MGIYESMTDGERAEWRARRARAWERLSPEHRTPLQVLGKRLTIGCVALEITQRCNLDCTLCYLGENSEKVPEPSLEEIKRRADMIVRDWGPNTSVQITGGDPTLREREELVEIVRYCREIGLLPALFTNGIKASRSLLAELVSVGLTDVAFHVDVTQERKGYKTEADYNEIRKESIERVRGLPVAVIFNITVCEANVDSLPDLVRFFRRNADVVGMCSFQLGADTGRGADKQPPKARLHDIRAVIDSAFEAPLAWDTVLFGHPSCHSIAYTLQVGDGAYTIDLGDDPQLTARMLQELPELEMDRTRPVKAAVTTAAAVLGKPGLALDGLRWLGRTLRRHGPAVVRHKFKVNKLSVFIQNFQDADNLDPDRIKNCSFMVATNEGTISMCLHNARRDEFIFVGVDRLNKKVPQRGVPREAPPRLPAELAGPIAPGGAGLPGYAQMSAAAPRPAGSSAATWAPAGADAPSLQAPVDDAE